MKKSSYLEFVDHKELREYLEIRKPVFLKFEYGMALSRHSLSIDIDQAVSIFYNIATSQSEVLEITEDESKEGKCLRVQLRIIKVMNHG